MPAGLVPGIRYACARLGRAAVLAMLALSALLAFPRRPARAAETAGGTAQAPELASSEEVTVTGQPFREDRVFGPNRQPEWTARRRFTNADVYVQAPWQVETSVMWSALVPEEGHTRNRFRQEFELGLPWHLQADLELTEDIEGGEGEFDSVGVEVRWALADWDVIPLNPTLYGEWEFVNAAADEFELKLLLGDTVVPRLYTAVNFFYEQQVGDEREQEFAVSNAWSYALLDRTLGVGLEARLTLEHEEETKVRANGEVEIEDEFEALFQVGPSLQWRITDDVSLVGAPLFGLTEEAPTIESFVALRVYWGPGAEGEEPEGEEQTPSMEAR